MCAIAGVVHFQGLASEEAGRVSLMLGAMAHRGPDGEGQYSDNFVSFGHRRLILLDAEGGQQPFFSRDRHIVVIFNGEIYNHQVLRQSLQSKGYTFDGYSDGEIIAHLYELYGIAFLSKLDGMFAMGIYDARRQHVFLARDRTGEKPLFYTMAGGKLYFASSIRPLIDLGATSPTLNAKGIVQYFAYTQCAPPDTMINGIKKVPPAHFLRLRNGAQTDVIAYWNIDYTQKVSHTFEEAVDQLDNVLRSSVRATSVSDYPAALTLSGGVDSSLILAYLAEQKETSPTSFSLGSNDSSDPEFERAQRAAAWKGGTTARFVVHGTAYADMVAAMEMFDEPVGVYDSIYLLQHSYVISQSHRMALTGNGADELFGGYSSYQSYSAQEYGVTTKSSLDDMLARLMCSTVASTAGLLYNHNGKQIAREYCGQQPLRLMQDIANYDCAMDARLFYDLYFGMAHCASIGDVVGMAFGLEYRSPFLSRPVIEYAARLPAHWKANRAHVLETKIALKEVASRHFPRAWMTAPKFGCGQFIDRYELMRTRWADDVEAAISRHAELLAEIICVTQAKNLWRAFLSGKVCNDERRLPMKLAILLSWLDAHAHCF
jgi:asparagine synthase (glutamine-hydrolysing)